MKVSARLGLLTAIVLVLVFGATPAAAERRKAARSFHEGNVDAFVSRLQSDGFVVQEGRLAVADLGSVCCAPDSPLDCTYFNAASPYLAAFLPPAPGQTAPELPFLRDPAYPDLSISWRLRPDEAVVFVGLTPPPARYFGFQSYRWFTLDEQGQRVRRWNNFGDQTNQLTIFSAGTPNGTPGNPFDSLTVRITTADRGIDARVREAARRAGFPPPIMNTEPMPQSLLRMGIDAAAEQFNWVLRTALPDDPAALARYKADPPVRVLRVTPASEAPSFPTMSRDPFPVPGFRAHGTGRTEFELLPAVRRLREAVLSRYADSAAMEMQSEQWLFYGLHHMDANDDGLAPSADALYLRLKKSFGTLSDDPNEFIVVYGVNHHRTGKAMYMNISVYGETKHVTSDSVDDPQLAGTAAGYLPGDPDAAKLYVYKFARHCGGEADCFEVPYGCCDPETPEDCVGTPGCPGLAASELGLICWRAYLDPVSRTGPDPAELLYDRAIKFTPKP